jgi:hypothetical protein
MLLLSLLLMTMLDIFLVINSSSRCHGLGLLGCGCG